MLSPFWLYVSGLSPETVSQDKSFAARWQSGYAAACKAVYLGSIPGRASKKLIKKARGCGLFVAKGNPEIPSRYVSNRRSQVDLAG